MKLGLAVVYLVSPENEGLLRLHLDQIARLTTMPHRIYAAANRLLPEFRPLLCRDDVTIVDLPRVEYRGGAEHSYYLKGLTEAALADGCSHVCMLHVDSFPVAHGWDDTLCGHLERGAALAAMLREENTDTLVPCTACLFFPAEFYRTHGPINVLPGEPSGDPQLEAFRRQRGVDDSGVIWGYWLHSRALPWHRLLRSNRVSDHPVMGGLYDDLVFHLGAHARPKWTLRDDDQMSWERWRLRVRRFLPLHVRLVPPSLKRLIAPRSTARLGHNESAFRLIRGRLLADPEGYLEYLRGNRPNPPAVPAAPSPAP